VLQTPSNLAPADIRQWYDRTWVSVEGYVGPRYVTAIDGTVVCHCDESPPTEAQQMVASLAKDVRGHWPRLGAVNLPLGFGVYVSRRVAKSYRRSLNLDAISVTVPNEWAASAFARIPRLPGNTPFYASGTWLRSVCWPLVKALWTPQYPTFQEAVAMLSRNEAVSVALSRTTIISEVAPNEKLEVFHSGASVGYSDFCGAFSPKSGVDGAIISAVNKRLQINAYY
jgi:hypothetical protein